VGPILAGLMFGWVPALLWIVLGSVFIGGVHDMTALVASVRHKARSIAEVVRDHMSQRSYVLFLTFIWIALIYIIVAFTDITAASSVGWRSESLQPQAAAADDAGRDGERRAESPARGIATSSLLMSCCPSSWG
jgi:hypothetical protein